MNVIALAFFVATAAGFGGVCRYGLARWLNTEIPVGTMVANIAASGFLAFVLGWEERPELVLGVGFAGSLSTWSTLAGELVTLVVKRRIRVAAIYIVATLIGGIGAAIAGLQLGSAF